MELAEVAVHATFGVAAVGLMKKGMVLRGALIAFVDTVNTLTLTLLTSSLSRSSSPSSPSTASANNLWALFGAKVATHGRDPSKRKHSEEHTIGSPRNIDKAQVEHVDFEERKRVEEEELARQRSGAEGSGAAKASAEALKKSRSNVEIMRTALR